MQAAILLASLLVATTAPVKRDIPWTDYDAADAQLAAAYDALLANVPAPNHMAVRNSERLWIALKNRRCGANARNQCATLLTRARLHELERQLSRTRSYLSLNDQQLRKLANDMNDMCRGPGQDTDGAVCGRRDQIVTLLQRKGWCWGSEYEDSVEADFHWVRCSHEFKLKGAPRTGR